jgi:hypothetical protein
VSRLAAFRADDAAVEAALEAYRPTLEAAWARQVKRLARVAVANLHRHQPIVAASEPPDWSMPNDDEVLPIEQQRALVAEAMRREFAAMHKILLDTGASAGLSFDTRNRIVDEVIAERGQHITRITETIRAEIMTQLREAYAAGESLPQASRRVAATLGERSTKRAQVIAATELAGAKNGASVRLASILSGTSLNDDGSVRQDTLGHDPIKLWKIWYATMDHRTRPTHAQANGQQVPINQPFDVGGSSLDYPGDPSGPGDEVIHCRCTVAYTEAAP